ncbi:hypothetical protein N9P55_00245 [bacterium]|nr:hypothetical protein [bacterium]
MKKLLLLIFISSFSSFVFSQKVLDTLEIKTVFGEKKLKLNKEFYSNTDTIKFTTVRFYISNIQFQNKNTGEIYTLKKYHLIDLENLTSLTFPLLNKTQNKWDSISFNIGIDSNTNKNGALGGDLDPTNGMYWTWQSGYINTKIEGYSAKCSARKNYFQFHIGGYQHPNQTIKRVSLPINNNVIVDFKLLFSEINLQTTHTIMSPGKKAVNFSSMFSSSFKTKK